MSSYFLNSRCLIISLCLLLTVPGVVGATELLGSPVTGHLEDAMCNAETVKDVNHLVLNRDLEALTSQTYFRLFQVDMENKCTYFDKEDDTNANLDQ